MRQRFLLVHAARTDPRADGIADELVAIMQRVLPEANAMVARSPNEQRLINLLTTGQAVLAVLRPELARDAALERGALGAEGAWPVRLLAWAEDRMLATVESFPAHHAWLVAAALIGNPGALRIRPADARQGEVPAHPGAAAFARGEPLEAAR